MPYRLVGAPGNHELLLSCLQEGQSRVIRQSCEAQQRLIDGHWHEGLHSTQC